MRTWLWPIAVIAAVITAASWRPDTGLPAAVAAKRIEARVNAFDFPWRGSPTARHEYLDALKRRFEEAQTPENIRRFALAELSNGKIRAARDLLIEAGHLQPTNASILSDLAAAEIAAGQIAEAAETAGRALRLDPGNEVAAFNWALALEKLSIRPAAIQAWERVLSLDEENTWADEARHHLAILRAPHPTYKEEKRLLQPDANAATFAKVVAEFPQRSRGFAQNYVLPRWVEKGDPGDLALMRGIANARARLGDPYLFDIVEHTVANRDAVAPGLREFCNARVYEEKADWNRAAELFGSASELLTRAGSPLAIGAAVYAAQGEFTSGRNDAAFARLTSVAERLAAGGNRYPTLAAESRWVRAMIAGRTGHLQESLDNYRTALAEAKRGGEIEAVAAITTMIAWTLESIDDRTEAEEARLESLRLNDAIHAASDRMYWSYLDTAYVALRADRPHLALALVDALTAIARETGLPLYLAESESWRALGLLEIGDVERASLHIAAARAHAMRIEDAGLRDFTLANIDYTDGRIEARRHPDRAILRFSSAVAVLQQYDWHAHLPPVFLARGQAELQRGNAAAAERDFRAGIAEMETQRAMIEDPIKRVAFFERSGDLFDRLIELLLREERAADALTVLERKRGRLLLDRIADGGGIAAAPLAGSEIAASVRGQTAIFEIALLEKNIEFWLVREGRIVHARGGASPDEIEAVVRKHLAAIAGGDTAAVQRSGRWLYERILAPLLGPVKDNRDLVIVGDGVLQSFPFATLVTADGAYLIDHCIVASAPSASVFLRSVPGGNADTLVAVAEPAPTGFDPLPSVESEVREIRGLYPRGQLLVGDDVTPADFLTSAAHAGVVHFGGHATAELDEPATSSLIFESAPAAVRLTAREISGSKLIAHPLVVLAACSTARGKLRRTEGIDSLASAFLQAGARGVTATLWDIDDDASRQLFESFHRNLRRGARPSEALRDAQRAMLHSNDTRSRSPAVWGSVTLVGTL
ncbi:MAG TPA: CHAT domain-containing protein [Thermoanaerobaculia bacterium]|nr:CHAT domain-containing protein [Thermoanaerobaculia bacterium]